MGCRSGEAGGPQALLNRKDIYTQSIYQRKGAAGNQRAANDPPTARALAGRCIKSIYEGGINGQETTT